MPVPFHEGAQFPDYVLPDHTDTPRRLSALQAGEPMLLMLSRGSFCPKEREQLKAMTRFYPQLVVGSCRLVVRARWDAGDTNAFQYAGAADRGG